MKTNGISLFRIIDPNRDHLNALLINLSYDNNNSGSNRIRKIIRKNERTTIVESFHKKISKDNLEHSYRLDIQALKYKPTKCEKITDDQYCSYIQYFSIGEKTFLKYALQSN